MNTHIDTESKLYRFFSVLPGLSVWLTFFLMVFLSFKFPGAVSIFFIFYAFFWLLRLLYLHFHLRVSFNRIRENLKVKWFDRLKTITGWEKIYHLVILPMYKESYEVVEETFKTLESVNYPKDKIIVVLAIEERAGKVAKETAEKIQEKFGAGFLKFLITAHPDGLSGEIPGKASNETWAAREAKEKIIDSLKLKYEDIIVSVFDIDTQVVEEYFGCLTRVFLTCEKPQRSSYQPIPLFFNNIFKTPIFSRVMAFFPTFWQMIQQSRFEQLSTFTSQAMPFKALTEIDFWDKHLVSEDSLIFWKFYIHYDGDWRTEPLYYPVSLDAIAMPTVWQSAVGLYKQQRRWAWGSENIPYMLCGFLKNKRILLTKKIFWTFIFAEGFYSWATMPFILFFLGWLPLFLGGYNFSSSLLSYNLPKITGPIMSASMFGVVASAILSSVLLPARPKWFKRRHYLIYLLQWFLVPFVIVFFSAVPAIESQTRLMLGGKFRLGFWPTPKTRKI